MEDFVRRSILLDLSCIHDQYLCAKLECFRNIMSNKENGNVRFVMDTLDFFLELIAGNLVNRAKRLVHKQNVWRRRKRAGNTYALCLASGEFGRIVIFKLFVKTYDLHPFGNGILGSLGILFIKEIGHISNILFNGHVWEQNAALDGVADVSPQLNEVLLANVFSINKNVSAGGRSKAIDHFEKRCFAATRRSNERDKFTLLNRKRQIADDDFLAIGFVDMLEFDCSCHGYYLLHETLGHKVFMGHVFGLPAVGFNFVIHTGHVLVGDGVGKAVEKILELRMFLQDLASHYITRLI